MFSKKTDRLRLIIGESSKISGDVEALGTIIVDGSIIGHVTGSKVILGEKACVRGDISASHIVIGGMAEGQLKGKERVELRPTGRVHGDIFTPRLSVTEGAVFNGTSCMDKIEQTDQSESAEKKTDEPGERKVLELLFKGKSS
ncbi:MAG: Polymer-forming cytoskeletal [Syntrophaceae bacterium PtaB.Bin095]|jgi:cytoskeletal protein CcmA (bactofilin family)|nr:MAG: Polymer-forming cytoskeletal [Syntrophaceae bacterium PtaB.Bin095]